MFSYNSTCTTSQLMISIWKKIAELRRFERSIVRMILSKIHTLDMRLVICAEASILVSQILDVGGRNFENFEHVMDQTFGIHDNVRKSCKEIGLQVSSVCR